MTRLIRMIILFVLLSLSISFFSITPVHASPADFLVINQIRGDEKCCNPGKIDLIQAINQIKNVSKNHISYALRYDALTDNTYTSLLKSSELGLLLEITPDLASASGVHYKGKPDGSDWYLAKNSMLIGYTVNDRQKIIDRIFTDFKNKFGYYPEFTVAWMTDAWSLQYMNNRYGVKLHELTKEQYETDSYTLYGGVFNAPYYPSAENPILPGYAVNKLPLLVVRQTISDLMSNYGSPVARFTSQPNDYSGGYQKKDFSYFRELVDDSINQSQIKFGLVGLENSYDFGKYGNEYLKQLDYLSKLTSSGKIQLTSPSEFAAGYMEKYKENPFFILQKQFNSGNKTGVLWYFGKTYRARVIFKENKVILDDLRVYVNFTDPYKDIPAESDYSYWIVPYIIDASQQYTPEPGIDKRSKELIGNVAPDTLTKPFGLVLGEGPFDTENNNDELKISFTGENKGRVTLTPESVLIDKSLLPYFNDPIRLKIADIMATHDGLNHKFDRQFNFYVKPENDRFSIGWERDKSNVKLADLLNTGDTYQLIPQTKADNLDILNPMFQPDRSGLSVDTSKSIFYWNNRSAIAGRNPVMLYILPLNSLGRPVQVKDVKIFFSKNSDLDVIYPDDYSYRVKPWFIIISSATPQQNLLSLTIDGKTVVKDVPIEFITDCRKQTSICIRKPSILIKYILQIIGEQINRLTK